jgi:hypothetical protein
MTNSSCNCNCTTPQYTLTLNAQGPQGATGSQGVAGFSPVVSVVQDTGSTYQLSITSAEGTILTPNLKSNLPSGGTTGTYLAGLTGDSPLWTNFATTVLSSALAIDGSNATGTLTLAPTDILLNPTDKAMYKGSELATVTNVSNEASLRTTADTTLQNQITANTMALTEKQDTLTAGSNISISGNTISCTVDTTNFVTTNTDQSITGTKTFVYKNNSKATTQLLGYSINISAESPSINFYNGAGDITSHNGLTITSPTTLIGNYDYQALIINQSGTSLYTGDNSNTTTHVGLRLDKTALKTYLVKSSDNLNTSTFQTYTYTDNMQVARMDDIKYGNITGTITDQTDLQIALDAKQNNLTFDTTPTSGSTNPVTSGGVYTFVNTAITNAITTAIGGSY